MMEIFVYTLIIPLFSFWGIVFGGLLIAHFFPTSKVSGFIRRHIITDQDLEA